MLQQILWTSLLPALLPHFLSTFLSNFTFLQLHLPLFQASLASCLIIHILVSLHLFQNHTVSGFFPHLNLHLSPSIFFILNMLTSLPLKKRNFSLFMASFSSSSQPSIVCSSSSLQFDLFSFSDKAIIDPYFTKSNTLSSLYNMYPLPLMLLTLPFLPFPYILLFLPSHTC